MENSEHPSAEVIFGRDNLTPTDIRSWIEPTLDVPDRQITHGQAGASTPGATRSRPSA